MGLVDTIMVGPLGPEAIAATGLGTSVFTAIAVFGMGLLLGLDTLVSQAFGGGRIAECQRLLEQGLRLAALLALPLMLASAVAYGTMPLWRLNSDIAALARPYLAVVTLSAPPLLVYAALRRYLQGIHLVRPVMMALVSANLVNILANYVLIYGYAGIPAMGVPGSALATTLARCYMAAFLWVAVQRTLRGQPGGAHSGFDRSRLVQLIVLGLPAAAQVTLEVGAFTFATAMAARLDAASSAAHQIALNLAGLAYMVPLGLCSAAAVRVGHAVGAGDPHRAAGAGWSAIGLAGVLAIVTALVMVLVPGPILRAFTTDAHVVMTGTALLAIAAAFQLFDSIQTVAIGALRGLGDTVVPMITNLFVHWILGLPIGYFLCFGLGWGVVGIWVGFSVGLVVAAAILLTVWARRIRSFVTTTVPAAHGVDA